MSERMVDPRQPRFGQAVTGSLLLMGYILDWPLVIPLLAVVLAGAPSWGLGPTCTRISSGGSSGWPD